MREYNVIERSLTDMVDEIAERVQRKVDQAALDKAADTLAEFGYVKVVRCRDCKHHHEGMCMLSDGIGDFKRWYVDDDGFCSDGERSGE